LTFQFYWYNCKNYNLLEDIKNHLILTFKLTEEEADIFLSAFTQVELQKNDVFFGENNVCNKIGLVKKGLLKCVYNYNGDEKVFEFAYENNFIADYYSFVTGTPSIKEIICLEDTTLYVITKNRLKTLSKSHSFIERISRLTNERLFLRMHERLTSFLLDSPSQRYQKLISERKDLAQRIPQYLIASYLNVKPETISRIRKKLLLH
jgi:CRP-like cAMP-binding protein